MQHPRNIRRRPVAFQLAAALGVCIVLSNAAADSAAAQVAGSRSLFDIELSARQVVAGRAAPANASGSAVLRVTPHAQTTGRVVIDGIRASRVTLNRGHAGEAGPVIAEFSRDPAGAWLLRQQPALDPLPYAEGARSGYYIRVESDDGALRGQVVSDGWHLQVVHLAHASLVPQLPVFGEGIAGIAVDPDAGSYHLRLTTSGLRRVVRAQLRSASLTNPGQVFVDLEPSAHDFGVWGSDDMNGACASGVFSAAALQAWRKGELSIHVEVLDDASQTMHAHLPPATDAPTPESTTQ